MKIIGVCLKRTGSPFYRLIPQLKFLERQGHQVKLEHIEEIKNETEKFKWADLVILENVFSNKLVRSLKKNKKKVIVECDDLVEVVPKTHYNYLDVNTIFKRIIWYLRVISTIFFADGFITPNKKLLKRYGWIAKKKLFFDNYCDLEHWIRPKQENKTDRIRILWAGSKSHTEDMIFLKPIIKEILEKYKDKVEFLYMGIGGVKSKDLYDQYVYGKDIFEDLSYNRETVVGVDPEIFPHILSSLGVDIGIAILIKDKFNKHKSQCKYLEYAINQIPGVYSKWFYTNVKQGDTGLLAETREEWIEAISYLIENKEERRRISKLAFKDVLENYDIRGFLPEYQEFIESIN